LLVILSAGTGCALSYADLLNSMLGIETTKIELPDGLAEDTVYFKSEFGEMNAENQAKLLEAAREQSVNEMREGAVLLRNENGALPLASDERRVTIFGRACVDPVYRCSSSGNMPKEPDMSSLETALTGEGFSINPTLWEAYQASEVKRSATSGDMQIGEVPVSFYTQDLRRSWASDYNDMAVIFLSRESGEGADFEMNDAEGISQLALHKDELDMIKMVTSDSSFQKVIVLLNSPVPIELEWLGEYGIDACLWMGTPGQWGFEGVAEILTGKTNPSGHTVDTYAANSLSAPAAVNSGTNTPQYTNAADIRSQATGRQYSVEYVSVQVENIYVGYKYYETRYEDSVLGQGNAQNTAGSSFPGANWDYAKEVTYPFGYGLSYTTFEQTLGRVAMEDGAITADVTVKNTGSVAGKSVVQLYAQTPYGSYEKENGIEKAAVQLVAFGKTGVLQPGQSETVTVSFDKYLLASYDAKNAKGYILSEGTYYLAIGDNAHDALNNILAQKGQTELVDPEGNPVPGNAEKVYTWAGQFDQDSYRHSAATGYEVTNRFDDCDLNYYAPGSAAYLSRADWAGTYPVAQTVPTATEEMIDLLVGNTYVQPSDGPRARDIVTGDKSEPITLVEMRDEPWDSEKWDKYIRQMTLDELATQPICNYGTGAVKSVLKNQTITGDGMDSIGGSLPFGDKPATTVYSGKVVLSCTWNHDLFRRRGELMGEEALYRGCVTVFSIGPNLHRTPFGGRNFEYISEDANFTYYAAMEEAGGMMSKGVNPAVKHFANNDQEFYRTGVSVFFTEQSIREITLRCFEGAIASGNTHALMQSYNRLGCTWASASYALCTEVCRNEWGFEGFEETDACSVVDYDGRFEASIMAGTDVYCMDSKKASGPAIVKAIQENDDGTLLLALQRAVKANHYGYVNSCAINGQSENVIITELTPVWEIALIAAIAVAAAGTVVCFVLYAVSGKKHTGRKGEESHG